MENGTVAFVAVLGTSVTDSLGSVKAALQALEPLLRNSFLTMLRDRAWRHQLGEVFLLLGLCERDLIGVDTCLRN